VVDLSLDDFEETSEQYKRRSGALGLILPIVALLVVVGIVCGLVFGGALQGDEVRTGPSGAPTTQATVLIAP
jgi:hypothetical protein